MKPKIRLIAWARSFALCWSLLLAATTFAADPEFYRYLHHQKIAVEVVTDRIAIRTDTTQKAPAHLTSAGLGHLAADLGAAGAPNEVVEELDTHGWAKCSFHSLPPGLAKKSGENTHDWLSRILDHAGAAAGITFASPILHDDRGGEVRLSGRILLSFREGVPDTRREVILNGISHAGSKSAVAVGRTIHWHVMSTAHNGLALLDEANRLAELPEIEFAEPEYIVPAVAATSFAPSPAYASTSPSVQVITSAWAIKNYGSGNVGPAAGGTPGFDLDVTPVFSAGTLGDGVTIAVLDDGVQYGHPYIQHILPGADFTPDQPNVTTPGAPYTANDVHGTEVAGCIVGTVTLSNGSEAYFGSAPHARILPIRIFYNSDGNGNGSINTGSFASALNFAQANGARVTNTSVGLSYTVDAMTGAYDSTTSAIISSITGAYNQAQNTHNMVHFAAAGNTNGGALIYPGAIPSVNAVSSVDHSGNWDTESALGNNVKFCGPGVYISTSIRNSNLLDWFNGTSLSSAYCAGVAALVVQAHSDWSAASIEWAMASTARKLGSGAWNQQFGYGMPDANAVFANNLWQMFNTQTVAMTATGNNVTIMGFAISGSASKQMLIRGAGPLLANFGLTGVSDPLLTLYNSQNQSIGSNQGWNNSSTLSSAAQQVGAYPFAAGSNDSALLATLSPGTYTAIVSSASGSSGYVLGEVYDMQPGQPTANINNLSSRVYVPGGSANGTLTFVIQGNASKQTLIRAVGPTLQNFGISTALPTTTMTVSQVSGGGNTVIATNTGWSTASNASAIQSFAQTAGAFPLASGSADSALLLTLAPGTYQVTAHAVGGEAGIALLETYKAP